TDIRFSTQLSHYGGKYSVERLLALEEYIERTPFSRVVLVSVGTPAPIVALVVFCQESVPLQRPDEGWQANYGFWVRVAVQGAVIAFASAIHIGHLLDGAALSHRQLALYTLTMAVIYVGIALAIAANWVFPTPFLHMILAPHFGRGSGVLSHCHRKKRISARIIAVSQAEATQKNVRRPASDDCRLSSIPSGQATLLSIIKLALKNLLRVTITQMDRRSHF
ncbi:hypothetical protein PHYSODRAFT_535636, partial [Phytophthora sojae]